MKHMPLDEALRAIEGHFWKHSFEIIPGVVTKGDWGFSDSAKLLDEVYGLPKDLSGLKALDIGTLDGIHAFELERRGANVVAMDIQSPDVTGFNIAKRIIGSNVEYVQGSVYDIDSLIKEKFDIVLFFGVWYHLKNPVIAFEQVGNALKNGGLLLGEGEALSDYAESDGKPLDGVADRQFIELMSQSQLPISIYYPQAMKGDEWSWYVPNLACVKAWMETACVEYDSHSWWHDYPHQRLHVKGRKNDNIRALDDNPVW